MACDVERVDVTASSAGGASGQCAPPQRGSAPAPAAAEPPVSSAELRVTPKGSVAPSMWQSSTGDADAATATATATAVGSDVHSLTPHVATPPSPKHRPRISGASQLNRSPTAAVSAFSPSRAIRTPRKLSAVPSRVEPTSTPRCGDSRVGVSGVTRGGPPVTSPFAPAARRDAAVAMAGSDPSRSSHNGQSLSSDHHRVVDVGSLSLAELLARAAQSEQARGALDPPPAPDKRRRGVATSGRAGRAGRADIGSGYGGFASAGSGLIADFQGVRMEGFRSAVPLRGRAPVSRTAGSGAAPVVCGDFVLSRERGVVPATALFPGSADAPATAFARGRFSERSRRAGQSEEESLPVHRLFCATDAITASGGSDDGCGAASPTSPAPRSSPPRGRGDPAASR